MISSPRIAMARSSLCMKTDIIYLHSTFGASSRKVGRISSI
jgi:hypothetical protein